MYVCMYVHTKTQGKYEHKRAEPNIRMVFIKCLRGMVFMVQGL